VDLNGGRWRGASENLVMDDGGQENGEYGGVDRNAVVQVNQVDCHRFNCDMVRAKETSLTARVVEGIGFVVMTQPR